MGVPTWAVGQVLTASDVNNWFVPLAAEKGSDQPVTSSTTLVNDSALVIPVAASATYDFDLQLFYKGFTTGSGDIKIAWSLPSGATLVGGGDFIANPLGVTQLFYTQATASIFSASNGTANPQPIRTWGTLVTSTTAGNMQLQWAQNTSSGTATTVMTGSVLTAQRIG